MGKQTSTKPPTSTLKISLASDTGLSSSDLVTSNGATLATRAYATDVLGYRLSSDGGVTWSAWTATSGAIPAPSFDGTWIVQVRETTTSGKLKGTTTLTFKLDTVALAPTLTLVNDTGAAGDGITQDGSVQAGALEAGARVEYSIDGGVTWQSTFAAQEGANNLLARQVDVAGNVSAPASLAFTLDTQAPVAAADGATTAQDTPVAIDLMANDTDATALSLESLGAAAHGTLSLNPDGTVQYTPDAGYAGADAFSYTVVDAAGLASTATVDVVVTAAPVEPPPAAQPFTPLSPADTGADAVVQALLAPNSGIAVDAGSIAWHSSGPGATNLYDGSLAPLAIGAGLLLTSGTTPGTANTMEWFGVDNADYADPNGYDNGDADLDAVVNTVFSTVSYDATALSFDFEVTDPAATSISFDVVFGSDEFPEWVDQFVDLAIVLVNGQNVALFDHDPLHPLSVIGSNLAGNYFIDNGAGVLPIEYDGVSAHLKIVAPIHAGTNSLKIAVGDTGDHIYDSGIFIANLAAGTLPGTGMLIDDGSGTSADDNCAGGAGSELIDLQAGDDVVNAGAGDDVVLAGDGNDAISGGSGSDLLSGGAGADQFDYSDPDDWAVGGLDTITDFAPNTVALDNAPSVDAIDGDVLVFYAAALALLAGGSIDGFTLPGAGAFSTLAADGLSARTDGVADAAHAQFVYDAGTGLVSFDADGTGMLDAQGVTLIGTHPASLSAFAFVIEG